MEAPATVRAPGAVMWTRDDCDRMQTAGLLPAAWELVNGEIITKMGQNLPHASRVSRLFSWLTSVFGPESVLTHCSIDVAPEDNPTSKPEPDLTVVSGGWTSMRQNPTPREIVLVVEVSDTTLEFDLNVKAGLYARAGIGEYWVVDINGRRVHQFREPGASGYRRRDAAEGEAAFSPAGRSEALSVAQLFR